MGYIASTLILHYYKNQNYLGLGCNRKLLVDPVLDLGLIWGVIEWNLSEFEESEIPGKTTFIIRECLSEGHKPQAKKVRAIK